MLRNSPVRVVLPLYVLCLKSYLSRWRDYSHLNQRTQPVEVGIDLLDSPIRYMKQIHTLRRDDFGATLLAAMRARHSEHACHSASLGHHLALCETKIW